IANKPFVMCSAQGLPCHERSSHGVFRALARVDPARQQAVSIDLRGLVEKHAARAQLFLQSTRAEGVERVGAAAQPLAADEHLRNCRRAGLLAQYAADLSAAIVPLEGGGIQVSAAIAHAGPGK